MKKLNYFFSISKRTFGKFKMHNKFIHKDFDQANSSLIKSL